MWSAFLKLLQMAAKFGPKVVKFLKAAWGVISKYGMAGVNWVKDNIGLIVDVISGIQLASDFVKWLAEQLKHAFGY